MRRAAALLGIVIAAGPVFGELSVSVRSYDRRSKTQAGRIGYSAPACRASVDGFTLMKSLVHLRCLPDAVGRPPGKLCSSNSRSAISSAFISIQLGRGRLLEPPT